MLQMHSSISKVRALNTLDIFGVVGGGGVCELYKFPASTLDPVAACTSDFRQGRE